MIHMPVDREQFNNEAITVKRSSLLSSIRKHFEWLCCYNEIMPSSIQSRGNFTHCSCHRSVWYRTFNEYICIEATDVSITPSASERMRGRKGIIVVSMKPIRCMRVHVNFTGTESTSAKRICVYGSFFPLREQLGNSYTCNNTTANIF